MKKTSKQKRITSKSKDKVFSKVKSRKPKQIQNSNQITPEEAVRFLEDIRLMQENRDEKTELISIRIPGNLLRALKLKAKADGKKYQSLIIETLRKALKTPESTT